MSALGPAGDPHLERMPPLTVPALFFVTAPVAVLAAGALLVVFGGSALVSNWLPQTLALTHLGTLGLLAMVMLGALYQLAPMLTGRPVPGTRSAPLVWFLLAAGLVGLVVGLLAGANRITFASMAVIAFSLLIFLPTFGVALLRAPPGNETLTGLRMALASLFLVAFLGLWMAHGHIGMEFPGPRSLWVQAHLSVGFLGWVGGLLSAVSWWLLPLFYRAPPFSREGQRAILLLLAVGVLLPVGVVFAELAGLLPANAPEPTRLAALGAAPAAIAVWLLHPALALRALCDPASDRRASDSSLRFWRAGLCAAAFTAGAAVAAHLLPHPRWGLLLGWLAIWGWAGMIVHGMLSRIVPLLVWLHRFPQPAGGAAATPPPDLLPDARIRTGFALHLTSAILGALAILFESDGLARATGLALMATAVQLELWLIGVLLRDDVPGASASA